MSNFDFEELKQQEQKRAISNAKSQKMKSGNQKDINDAILADIDAIKTKLGI